MRVDRKKRRGWARKLTPVLPWSGSLRSFINGWVVGIVDSKRACNRASRDGQGLEGTRAVGSVMITVVSSLMGLDAVRSRVRLVLTGGICSLVGFVAPTTVLAVCSSMGVVEICGPSTSLCLM
jgi:hypothetical protein